jgi:hypothetical protein
MVSDSLLVADAVNLNITARLQLAGTERTP